MLRRVVGSLAVALSLVAAPSARANIITPNDFFIQQIWALNGCRTFVFTLGPVSACVSGFAALGRNTTTGQYGVSYDVLPLQRVIAPAGMIWTEFCRLDFSSFSIPGSFNGPCFTSPRDVVYSSLLNENSRLVGGRFEFLGFDDRNQLIYDTIEGASATLVTAPEPQSLALLASGLVLLLPLMRRRRRSDRAT